MNDNVFYFKSYYIRVDDGAIYAEDYLVNLDTGKLIIINTLSYNRLTKVI